MVRTVPSHRVHDGQANNLSKLLGNIFPDEELDKFTCSFAFSHLSDDSATAFFRMDEITCEGNKSASFIYKYLQTYAAEMSYAIQEPGHIIQIRRFPNDSPIPGLSFHFDNPEDAASLSRRAIPNYDNFEGLEILQLSCDWRELYIRFWGGEWFCNETSENWLKSQTERAKEVGNIIERGEADWMATVDQLAKELGNTVHEGRRIARRARVRRQLKELEGQEAVSQHICTEQERFILKNLDNKREFLFMVDFSDDEGGEEEEEG